MKSFLIQSILLFAFISCSAQKSKAKMYIISGKVTETNQYCGGARPSQEMLDELTAPKPLADKVLLIKSGKINTNSRSVQKTKTDPYGNFTLILKAGTYCIVEESKGKKFTPKTNDEIYEWDNDCLKKNWEACDHLMVVGKDKVDNININYQKYCDYRQPCLKKFKGPLPQ